MKRTTAVAVAAALVLAVPAMPAQASHQGGRYGDERERCYDSDGCNDQEYDQNYGSRDDRNRNRDRNRGAFSPGPFDRSPVTIIICPPGTQYCGSDGGRNDQPPPEGKP